MLCVVQVAYCNTEESHFYKFNKLAIRVRWLSLFQTFYVQWRKVVSADNETLSRALVKVIYLSR